MTYLQSGEKGVVVGNDRKYTGVSHGGNENWTYVATGDLADLLPMEKLNIVMTVGKEQVSIFDMSKGKNTEPAAGKTDVTEPEADGDKQKPADTEAGKEAAAEPKAAKQKPADMNENKTEKPTESSETEGDTAGTSAENEG